jgi:hypothetical protein
MVANRAGYLRLAALFLRASVAPYEKEGSAVIDVDLLDVIDEDIYVTFSWLERQEKLEKMPHKPQVESKTSLWENLFPIGCVVFFLAIIALIIIGGQTAIGWLLCCINKTHNKTLHTDRLQSVRTSLPFSGG